MTLRMTLVHVLAAIEPGDAAAPSEAESPSQAWESWSLPGNLLVSALRAACAHVDAASVLFGDSGTPGALSLTDHTPLLVPIRSCRGVFAWVTSPLVLQRFLRDLDTAGQEAPGYVPDPGVEPVCLVGHDALKTLAVSGKAVLEDLDLEARGDAGVASWAQWLGRHLYHEGESEYDFWRRTLQERLCVVHDDVFAFLADRAVALAGRVRAQPAVDGDRIIQPGAIPPEAVLWGSAVARDATVAGTAISPDDVLRMVAELADRPVPVWRDDSQVAGVCKLRVLKE
jgi:CRISPR-associated protein Cmr4